MDVVDNIIPLKSFDSGNEAETEARLYEEACQCQVEAEGKPKDRADQAIESSGLTFEKLVGMLNSASHADFNEVRPLIRNGIERIYRQQGMFGIQSFTEAANFHLKESGRKMRITCTDDKFLPGTDINNIKLLGASTSLTMTLTEKSGSLVDITVVFIKEPLGKISPCPGI